MELIRAVAALHHEVAYTDHLSGDTPGCAECGPGWPCRTVRLIQAGVEDLVPTTVVLGSQS